MSTIRIKRGSGTPPLLADGEIAFDKSGKSLFVSDGTQNIEFKANPTTANIPDSTNKRYVSDAKLAVLNSTTGINTGNQTSIIGISGTKAQFNSAVTDGDILYVGDVAQYTDEMAQDAVGNMVTDTSTVRLVYNDGANSMYADVLPDSINANHLTAGIPLSKFVNNVGFEGASGLTLRDNANRNRVNHTGTQLASTISDFTTASRLATVEDTIADGVVDKAPSQNAVFDAFKVTNYSTNTGLLSGGGIAVNADPTKWNLTGGSGFITDTLTGVLTPITWATQTALTTPYLTSAVATHILIDINSSYVLQSTKPTSEQFRTHIYLGKLAHTTLTTILFAIAEPTRMFNTVGQIEDLNLVVGSVNIGNGNNVTPNGANLNINVSSGSTYRAGANYLTSRNSPSITTEPAVVAASFRGKYRNGAGGWIAVNASTIDPEFYDDGSGTLAPVPSNKFTVKTVWRFGGSGTLHIDYGQNTYNSIDEAVNSIGRTTVVQDPDTERDASKRGWIITKKGTTSLTDTTKALFLQAGKFGETGATGVIPTLQSSYDNSVTPEVVTNTTQGAMTVKRGSAADTDNVIEVQDGAGNITASFTGEGKLIATSTNLITEGSYTPTITNNTNITSSALISAIWSKVGDYTTVRISMSVTPTLVGLCVLTITTPTNTNASFATSGIGSGTFYQTTPQMLPVMVKRSSLTEANLIFVVPTDSSGDMYVTITYKT